MLNIDTNGLIKLELGSLIGQRVACLGSSGSGKSNTVAVLVEEIASQIPVTIFDVHDEYWGLCERYPFIRAGIGPNVDVQAKPEQAAELAQYSFEQRISVLVNMLYMDEADRLDFVHTYCQMLWRLNLEAKKPYVVVLEEAHNFIPQGGAKTPALKQLRQFAAEGRKFGFTIIMASQRSSKLNKDLLAECELAFLHRVNILNDAQAYQGMLPYSLTDTKAKVYSLRTGEVITKWREDGQVHFDQVQIRRRYTLHVANTPGSTPQSLPTLQRVDSTIIADLKKALPSKTPAAPQAAVVATVATTEVQALRKQNADLQAALNRMNRTALIGFYGLAAYKHMMAKLEQQLQEMQVKVDEDKAVRKSWSIPGLEIEGRVEDNGQFKITRQTTHIETIEGSHQSSRQIAIKIKRQEAAFNDLLAEVRKLRTNCIAILLEALSSPGGYVRLEDVAMEYDYALSTVPKGMPDLLRTGLVTKTDGGDIQSCVDAYLLSSFPALDAKTLRKRLNETVEMRLERG